MQLKIKQTTENMYCWRINEASNTAEQSVFLAFVHLQNANGKEKILRPWSNAP